jgi:hypothetical protein
VVRHHLLSPQQLAVPQQQPPAALPHPQAPRRRPLQQLLPQAQQQHPAMLVLQALQQQLLLVPA